MLLIFPRLAESVVGDSVVVRVERPWQDGQCHTTRTAFKDKRKTKRRTLGGNGTIFGRIKACQEINDRIEVL